MSMRSKSVLAAFAAIPIALLLLINNVQAQDARLTMSVGKVGFIVGAAGGNGTLTFRGKNYRVSVRGLSVGLTIGVAAADLVGNVYNLDRVSDIEGIYSAVSGSLAAGGGAGSMVLRNSKGVEVRLRGKQAGIEASIATNGLRIRLR